VDYLSDESENQICDELCNFLDRLKICRQLLSMSDILDIQNSIRDKLIVLHVMCGGDGGQIDGKLSGLQTGLSGDANSRVRLNTTTRTRCHQCSSL
jgi:hypothetical protein